MTRKPLRADPDCLLLTVEQAAHRLGIGRSTAYTLIASGQLHSIRIGTLRRVPVESLARFVESRRDQDATRSAYAVVSSARR